MFCPNCGAKQPDEGAKFCAECGAPLAAEAVVPEPPAQPAPAPAQPAPAPAQPAPAPAPAQPAQPAPAQPAPAQPDSPKKPNSKLIALIACGVLAVVAIVLVVVFVVKPGATAPNFEGTWVCVDSTIPNATKEQIEELAEQGTYITLTLNEDGTGALESGATKQTQSLTWKRDDTTHAHVEVEGESGTMTMNANRLTLIEDSTDYSAIFAPEAEVNMSEAKDSSA